MRKLKLSKWGLVELQAVSEVLCARLMETIMETCNACTSEPLGNFTMLTLQASIMHMKCDALTASDSTQFASAQLKTPISCDRT